MDRKEGYTFMIFVSKIYEYKNRMTTAEIVWWQLKYCLVIFQMYSRSFGQRKWKNLFILMEMQIIMHFKRNQIALFKTK